MASWSYNGIDTVSVTFASIPGHDYTLYCDDPHSFQVTETAIGTSTTLTVTAPHGVGGMDNSENFFAYLFKDSDGQRLVEDAVLFRFLGGLVTDVISFEYDGADTITLHVPTEIGADYFFQAVSGSQVSFTGDGTVMDEVIDLTGNASLGDRLLLWGSREDDPGSAGWSDGVSDVIVYGTPLSVVGSGDWHAGFIPPPPPPVPTNDSCANAQLLVGCSGSVLADNTEWAGTWPTGNDPLFNCPDVAEGGGAPLWYKWTNTQPTPMLFRVTIYNGGAGHPVAGYPDYNFGITIAPDCASIVFDDSVSDDNEGLNREFGNWSDLFVGDFFGQEYSTYFDLIVEPGHTAWFEIDSWTGDTSEPPTADSGHRGKFQFNWAALTYTTHDVTQSTYHTAPTDTSTLLADTFSPAPSGQILPFETLIFEDHLYLLWMSNEAHGDSMFAGDCNLDGTGLNYQRLHDAASGLPPGIIHTETPKLFCDGVNVFVGYAWEQNRVSGNPGYTDSCAAHAGETFFCFEDEHVSHTWLRYSLFKFAGSGVWTDIVLPSTDPLIRLGPSVWSVTISTDDPVYQVRGCMSDTDPGILWVHAVYRVVEGDESLHFNDYPITETPEGALWRTVDVARAQQYVKTLKVTISGTTGTVDEIFSDTSFYGEYFHWVSDNPHTNPTFGSWQDFADGDIFTDPTTKRDSPFYGGFDISNEGSYPIIAYGRHFQDAPGSSDGFDYETIIHIDRLDTGAALGTYTYDDFSDTHFPTLSDRYISGIDFTRKFVDPTDSDNINMGIASYWIPQSTGFPITWTCKISVDGINFIQAISPGLYYSSESYYVTLFPDIEKPEGWQWWSENQLVIADTFGLFSYCDGAGWIATWDGWLGPDNLGANFYISPRSAYDSVNEDWYFMVQNNQLRKAHVLRDYFICEPGPPCVGCPPSIFRFFKDGVWRQQNVDTEYSLWTYHDGAWVQNCTDLHGQLEGTWQT